MYFTTVEELLAGVGGGGECTRNRPISSPEQPVGPGKKTSSEAELPGVHPAEEAGGWYLTSGAHLLHPSPPSSQVRDVPGGPGAQKASFSRMELVPVAPSSWG